VRTLAIDQASAQAGLALLEDGRVTAELGWDEARPRKQQLFARLSELQEEAGIALRDVDVFAVDCGPGSFSGIRMSLAAAEGMAMPAGRTVIGVTSAEAVACDICRETGAKEVIVVGDARRQRLWVARFNVTDGIPGQAGTFSLVALDAVAGEIPDTAVAATPDWDRIGDALQERLSPHVKLVEGNRRARAATVGSLACRIAAGPTPPPPPRLVYLHPPVFVEPRFATAGKGARH